MDEEGVIRYNSDAIDLLSNGLHVESLLFLEVALRLARDRLPNPITTTIITETNTTTHPSPSPLRTDTSVVVDMNENQDDIDFSNDDESDVDIEDDDDIEGDKVIIEMVAITDDDDDDRAVWERPQITFALFNRPCFVFGSIDSDEITNYPRFVDKTIFALQYNIGLASHLLALNEVTNTLQEDGLRRALSMYQSLMITIQERNDVRADDDYHMLLLVIRNNITCILLHFNQEQEANRSLQMLSERVDFLEGQSHLFLDAYRCCKMNVVLSFSTVAICAPAA